MHLLLCLVVQVRVQFILFDLFRRKRMIVVDRAVSASAILLIQPDEAFRNTAQVSGTFIQVVFIGNDDLVVCRFHGWNRSNLFLLRSRLFLFLPSILFCMLLIQLLQAFLHDAFQVIGDFLCIVCCLEKLHLVILQGFQPALRISCMTDGIQGQSKICRQIGGSHLSTQLLLGCPSSCNAVA